MIATGVRNALDKACINAKGYTLKNTPINAYYQLRHNYATMLFYADLDIKEAQYLLGHKDIKITLNV